MDNTVVDKAQDCIIFDMQDLCILCVWNLNIADTYDLQINRWSFDDGIYVLSSRKTFNRKGKTQLC